jgi:SET domain-containing protein
LVAIKNIQKGEEITWDYSTTMKNDDWTMMCQCGAKNCRKIIKEFKFLPKERKLFYQKTGIIPQYITQ